MLMLIDLDLFAFAQQDMTYESSYSVCASSLVFAYRKIPRQQYRR